MKRNLYILSFGIGAMLLATHHAHAQPLCADHADINAKLVEKYGETRHAIAIASHNMVIEIYTSRDTGRWTMTATAAGGPTCVIAIGRAFQVLAPPVNGT